ncbi:zinc finger protein 143-like [Atheta coriaria]|uniref:zinc finger protein 143-like n=1 Tax=Dalotia coriaria TaxID=877792 RepID=UPI0031F3F93D
MVDNSTGEQAVYQYFTIIRDEDSFISEPDNTDYTFINNPVGSKDEDDQEVMYLVEPVSSDVVLNSAVSDETNNEQVNNEDSEYEYDPLVCPKVEFVLEDGQMYMKDSNTLKDVHEDYTFDPELISVLQEEEQEECEVATQEEIEEAVVIPTDSSATEITADMCNTEDDETSTGESNFWKVQLVDGTCAYINNDLLNSLIQNIKQEEKPKIVSPKQDKKIACSYYGCGKVYSSIHHLTVHMRNHTGSRPYQCPFSHCEKAFATGYSLKAHLRTHTGEAPYGCVVCQKHFKTSGDLQKHVRTHTGEKPFKCPIEGCGRSFTTSNIRKVHVRSHTGERPYRCTHKDCNKAFASATNFKNHMRIHSGEKPYKCPVTGCGKCFTEYSSLFKHNAVHKPFTPLKCEYCDQLCKHESTLRAHKQSMHKILVTEDGTEVQLRKESDGNYIFCSNE